MAFKFLVAFALVAVACAGYVPAPQVYHEVPHHVVSHPVHIQAKAPEPYDAHPHYQFSYSVHDGHTGDVKSQVESRDGDAVHGEYSLIDSDGYKRIVKYTADHENGFNAVVHREPLGHAVAPVLKAAPLHYAAAPVHSYHH